jgi:uncharacterized protein YjbJ (UPF0337 family)
MVAAEVKEEIGRAIRNPEFEVAGADEKLGGKIQRKVGDVEKVFDSRLGCIRTGLF